MTRVALVHGAWCGAWSWDSLTPRLRQEGHDVVAMDLPCEDASAGFETYAEVVCSALDRCNHDVVLVGHSLAANTIPLVAARRPVRHLVYVAGLMPEIGRSIGDQLQDDVDMMVPGWDAGLSEPDVHSRTSWIDFECARGRFLADCDEATVEASFNRLRAQANYPMALAFSLPEFPAISCTSVVYSDDQVINPDWSKRVARDMFAADLVELPGGHCSFFSQPSPLADVLLGVACND
jgi:pimeloyl-ACP methyl ester carboxylesterase